MCNQIKEYCKNCKWGIPLLAFFIGIGCTAITAYVEITFLSIFFGLCTALFGSPVLYHIHQDVKDCIERRFSRDSDQTPSVASRNQVMNPEPVSVPTISASMKAGGTPQGEESPPDYYEVIRSYTTTLEKS
ncbi:uncharacterized protein [Palaemon carinicauda]|uniref:uncharacterized protein n=1 Tax=Palaemon carinicauda TaxID=392227 RepID=UPI0035B6372F